jgi:hypothetical protein
MSRKLVKVVTKIFCVDCFDAIRVFALKTFKSLDENLPDLPSLIFLQVLVMQCELDT